MSGKIKIQVSKSDVISVVANALRSVDSRLVDHGDRVAYIAYKMYLTGKLSVDLKTLVILSVFHDVGAYKTDEIDRMVEFETKNVWEHAIYGYLFLRDMSPLGDAAQGVLYHHLDAAEADKISSPYMEYAKIISVADRADVMFGIHGEKCNIGSIRDNNDGFFDKSLAELLCRADAEYDIKKDLLNGTYKNEVMSLIAQITVSADEVIEYLKMLVYAIDFRSEHTVTHTVNTVAVSLDIARHFGLGEEDLRNIYMGAFLHDIGKIGIPVSILESAGKLSDDEMAVMRTHVEKTEKIIRGIVSDEVCNIACRHHEKLNGSGYPHRLGGEELSFPQRIVAVSDIVSALSGRRSYKEPFPAEKAVGIIREMQNRGELDPQICGYVTENYKKIVSGTDAANDSVMQMYIRIRENYVNLKKSSFVR